MGILNVEEYLRRLNSDNPVTIEELEDELKVLIKAMIEAATQGEITTHLGYEINEKSNSDNYRNGYNKKNLKSKYGEIEVNIPRDRNATFEPKLVKKRQRLLDVTEDLILSLYAKGMSIKDIQSHLDDQYDYELSTEHKHSHLLRIFKVAHKLIKVFSPAFYNMRIFTVPFFFKLIHFKIGLIQC